MEHRELESLADFRKEMDGGSWAHARRMIEEEEASASWHRLPAEPNIQRHWLVGRRRDPQPATTRTVSWNLSLPGDMMASLREVGMSALEAERYLRVMGQMVADTFMQSCENLRAIVDAPALPPQTAHGYRERSKTGRREWWNRRAIVNQPLNR